MSKDWAELLMDDHQTTERVFEAMKNAFERADGPSAGMVGSFIKYIREYSDGCHNKKEEDHLFPLLAERGIPSTGGPLAVMVAEHEQSRALLAELGPLAQKYAEGDLGVRNELMAAFTQYSELMRNHYWKENDILYPMGKRVMSDDDAAQVAAGIEATEAKFGADTRARYYALAEEIQRVGAIQDLSTEMSAEVIAALLNTLPIEVSFVDENDVFRYFNHEHKTKIFARSRGMIGRPVQKCHPEKSVHMVNRIIEQFKAGTREEAEFWIEMGGVMVHIRYFPLRNPEGRYLGCIETVQDITQIQKLEGNRRLLDS